MNRETPETPETPITITAAPVVWLEVGRCLGGSKRTITRLLEVLNAGHSEQAIGVWLGRIERLAMRAEVQLDESRRLWCELVDHQAPDLGDLDDERDRRL